MLYGWILKLLSEQVPLEIAWRGSLGDTDPFYECSISKDQIKNPILVLLLHFSYCMFILYFADSEQEFILGLSDGEIDFASSMR